MNFRSSRNPRTLNRVRRPLTFTLRRRPVSAETIPRQLQRNQAGLSGTRAEALLLVILGALSGALVPMLIAVAALDPHAA